MDKAISAADANRKFSEVLREVKSGKTYVVTSHGRPVARISPVGEGRSAGLSARRSLFQRLRAEPTARVGRWKREDLYD